MDDAASAIVVHNPALSTGYGLEMVRRGWGSWGDAPYTDLMTLTDATLEHPAVDATRTAAMGGSFGGYMANWIAGHTERFHAIVTHASLWDLEQFGPTTDAAENHWVLTPQHAKVWYQTVHAFLAVHVLGEDWVTPELLE